MEPCSLLIRIRFWFGCVGTPEDPSSLAILHSHDPSSFGLPLPYFCKAMVTSIIKLLVVWLELYLIFLWSHQWVVTDFLYFLCFLAASVYDQHQLLEEVLCVLPSSHRPLLDSVYNCMRLVSIWFQSQPTSSPKFALPPFNTSELRVKHSMWIMNLARYWLDRVIWT